jgi:hypothetical protein
MKSKLAALALGAAALNVHASPTVATAVVTTQAASQYQQAAVRPASLHVRTANARPAGTTSAPSPVPEPIHYKLMLLGLAALLLLGRRGGPPSKPWTK